MNVTRSARMPRLACLVAFVLPTIVSGLSTPLPARAQDDVPALIARIEAVQIPYRGGLDSLTVPQLMERLRVPGVSVAVIRNFKIHWTKAWGVADVATGRPVDENTLFQAASISKPVTAMAVVRLAQDGRLSLDADVNALLKSWRVPESALTRNRPVTLRSLSSHSSGADDGFGFPGYDPSAPRPSVVLILNGEAPSNVGSVTFGRPPFHAAKYSGGGVTIVQLALTDLLGTPFDEILKTYVLTPLGMANSTYQQPPRAPLEERTARAHNGAGRPMDAPWHVYPEQAAAGLWTTPGDLARFIIEVQTAIGGPAGKVLSQASAREMLAPVGVGPFAVGLQIESKGEGWYFRHGGANWGFRADIVGHFRNGYGVAIMTNGDNGTALINELAARIAAAYGWDSLNKPLPR